MAKKNTQKHKSKDELVHIAMSLSEKIGWAHIGLADIAQEAEISLAELHTYFDDKTDILVALGRMIDRMVLENTGESSSDESERDRLFDVLMERYDALNSFRPGLLSVLNSFTLDPKQAVISLPHLCRSMSWMMEAAGLNTNGWRGALQVTGLTALYLKGVKAWKDDESPDLAKVMATLDKDLGRAEKLANFLAL